MASNVRPRFGNLHDARILGVRSQISLPIGINITLTRRPHNRTFWHQILQLNLRGPARFITYDILRLPRSGLIQRYALNFLVFFLSGCLHVATDMATSIPPNDSGAIRFFSTQALGIMLEDGAQEIFSRLGGKHGLSSRFLGYVWLVVFLSCSTAVWQYPAILVAKREDIVFRLGSFRSLGPPSQL